jgi:drug/metabolite transporter (DMT)-like permease
LAIEREQLSFAYPFMALSFVLVPLASKFLFGEPISPLQYAGIVLVTIGVGLNAAGR